MRLGLLGPARGDTRALERAARFLRDDAKVERVVYLGVDGALDEIVQSWAQELVGDDAGESALVRRATAHCLHASANEIDDYLAREGHRSDLRIFGSLPDASTRSVELFDGKVAVLVHDKAYLEEEDILPANLLIFGRSRAPLIRKIGRRWFISPGSVPDAGMMIIEDLEGRIGVTSYSSASLEILSKEQLDVPREVNLRISSGS